MIGTSLFQTWARARRGGKLLDTTEFIVMSNVLRTGLVGFLSGRPSQTASLDDIVEFYFSTANQPDREDVDLLLAYYKAETNPTKLGYVHFLIERASWLGSRRGEVQFQPPSVAASVSERTGPPVAHARGYDWNLLVHQLHVKYDARFPGADPEKRRMARVHWDNFLVMADSFNIVRYENGQAQLPRSVQTRLEREVALFGDGYIGADDLLGVLLKVEALRGETDFIVTPPPFMLEACDALARRIGIESILRFSPRLRDGGRRILDLACGSAIYSNALAERGNQCVAVDGTPWVFYRAFLGARDGVRVEFCDMNALPEGITREPFAMVMCNLAAHHFQDRVNFFKQWARLLEPNGEICMLNFDYSVDNRRNLGPIQRLKRQFAAQVRYNWTVLDFARSRVHYISPHGVARDLESAGLKSAVHACDRLGELFLVKGVKG